MRIATYNIEWFANLFDADGILLPDGGWSGRHDVTRAQQIQALGIVFTALNADAIMIIEAPDNSPRRDAVASLEAFAAAFNLRTSKAVLGFSNNTQQEIMWLYDPNVMSSVHAPEGAETGKKGDYDAPRFDGAFRIDLDVDAKEDLVHFSKPPLELAVTTKSGVEFTVIGAHLKSKAPYGAKTKAQATRQSIANRRKQLAQAIWLRRRVDKVVADGRSLMVLGDLNDGPGLDEFEHLFGQSSVEILLGKDSEHPLFDPHARLALSPRTGAVPTTARFYMSHQKRFMQALLDYIMVSADLAAKQPQWRIWHPLDDPDCWAMPELRDALVTASDHFPVTLDIDLGS